MANYKSNDNSTLSTKLREWWTIVRSEFTRVFDILNGHFNGETDRHKAADIDTENGITVETALSHAQADIAANETAITELDARLENIEAEVMPVKSIVAETLTSDYISPISGVHLVVKDKYYSIPDGYKCTSIKVKIISENMTCEDGDAYLNFLGQDESHSSFDNPSGTFSLDTVNLSEGDNFITEIPEECKEIFVTVEKEVDSEESSCTIDVEITYEGVSKLDERFGVLEEKLDALEQGSGSSRVFTTTTQEITVPANSGVTYTVMLDDTLKAINLTTSLQGYPSSSRNDEHYGICVHDDLLSSSSTIDCVYSDETTELVEAIKNWYACSEEKGFGREHNFTLYNHTSTDAIVYVEEKRFNTELVETFATKEELEAKAEVEDVEAINSELGNKINISDASNMVEALDKGSLIKISNLVIPPSSTAHYTFLWENDMLPDIQFSCNDAAAIEPTEEYTGVRLVANSSTMAHIVCGDEPVTIESIGGEDTLIYGCSFTEGAENTFVIHNHTTSEVVVNVKERKASNIDGRLTAVENEVMSVTQVISETFTLKPINAKEYEIPDGYKCTSINVKATPSVDGQYGSIVLAESAFNSPFATTTLSTARVYDEVVISDIPDECNIIRVSYGEGATDTTCTFDVELTYKKTSALDERLTKVESSVGDIEIALDNIIAIQNELIGGESA